MIESSFSSWPNFSAEEADKVRDVLLSNKVNYWTGEEGRQFENEFAAWCEVKYSVALANGTLALDAALKALDVGLGDEVITTPRTFFATVSSIVMAGAKPVFSDVDPNSQNITAASIKKMLSAKTKAVIVVHLAGMPAEMDDIMALSNEFGFKVIEDCAQAHGAKYKGRSVGSIGHVGAWSFCQDKIMTTGGEGGMVTTNDKVLWQRMWSHKDHGKSYDAVYLKAHPPGFRWVHESFGTNWRLTEMQSAIGRIQLARMSEWSAQRRINAEAINEVCRRYKFLRVPSLPTHVEHAFYKFYAFVVPEDLPSGWSRDRIIEALDDVGVPCMQGSCSEVYLERAFDGHPSRPSKSLPVAKKLGETSLMFMVHPTIETDELAFYCKAIDQVFSEINRRVIK